jgi:hypothetical protein
MANETYTLIEKITVGAAGASSVTFTSIPQTYTDLKVVASARSARSGQLRDELWIRFNGDTGNNYTTRALNGSGTAAGSTTNTSVSAIYRGDMPAATATANTFGNQEIYIPNYTSSNQKSVSVDDAMENNATESWLYMRAGLWTGTNAITSITLLPEVSTFVQYSTFYLYGIAKEGVSPAPSSAPYATGGDSILFDGTYWIHTFTSSGTFTPKKNLSCDYLVVAGGGGSGSTSSSNSCGGGGAGGLRSTVTATGGGGSLESAISVLKDTAYTVTIGAGGSSTSNGSDSSLSGTGITTITSTGGGKGGNTNVDGSAGGSGGGAGGNSSSTQRVGGAGTANQGYAGGNESTVAVGNSGGGGGAGAVGGSVSPSSVGGNGGAGVAVAITGSSVTYAGGGGGGGEGTANGGTGGSGGGGNGGSNTTNAVAGTANTGGGAGGKGANTSAVASGGSGIVIVRYAA